MQLRKTAIAISVAAVISCSACVPKQPLLSNYKELAPPVCEKFNGENNPHLNRLLSRWDPVLKTTLGDIIYYTDTAESVFVGLHLPSISVVLLRMNQRGVKSLDHEMGHAIFNFIMKKASEQSIKNTLELCDHIAAINPETRKFIEEVYLKLEDLKPYPEYYMKTEMFARAVDKLMRGRDSDIKFVLDEYTVAALSKFEIGNNRIFEAAAQHYVVGNKFEEGPYHWDVQNVSCYAINFPEILK
ncbi:MAG: hypothetical protein V1492_04800 [Candidatus Micrarchaeota archaeon]